MEQRPSPVEENIIQHGTESLPRQTPPGDVAPLLQVVVRNTFLSFVEARPILRSVNSEPQLSSSESVSSSSSASSPLSSRSSLPVVNSAQQRHLVYDSPRTGSQTSSNRSKLQRDAAAQQLYEYQQNRGSERGSHTSHKVYDSPRTDMAPTPPQPRKVAAQQFQTGSQNAAATSSLGIEAPSPLPGESSRWSAQPYEQNVDEQRVPCLNLDGLQQSPWEPGANSSASALPNEDVVTKFLQQYSNNPTYTTADVSKIPGGSSGPGGLLSQGSASHFSGNCRPCSFYHKDRCLRGAACSHCHHEHNLVTRPGKKTRDRAKRQQERTLDPDEVKPPYWSNASQLQGRQP